MPAQPRPSFYTLSTTDGHQATLYVAPDDDPWQVATQYVRAHIASDSHLAALRIASAAEIAAFNAQLEGAQLEAALPPEPGSGATLPRRDAPTADRPPRGAKVNTSGYGRTPGDHPTWAGRAQQETWRSGVLVIWDHELRRIIGLSAQQALKLLAHLQASEDWRQDGVVLGAPMTQFVLGQPDRPPEPVLSDPIRLSPAEIAALLDLLRSHEEALQAQAEAEEADIRRRLGQVYTLLIDAAAKRRAQLAQGETKPELSADQPTQADSS